MDDKTGLAQVSFASHRMILWAERKKTERYKWAFWVSVFLLVGTNLCWFMTR